MRTDRPTGDLFEVHSPHSTCVLNNNITSLLFCCNHKMLILVLSRRRKHSGDFELFISVLNVRVILI